MGTHLSTPQTPGQREVASTSLEPKDFLHGKPLFCLCLLIGQFLLVQSSVQAPKKNAIAVYHA